MTVTTLGCSLDNSSGDPSATILPVTNKGYQKEHEYCSMILASNISITNQRREEVLMLTLKGSRKRERERTEYMIRGRMEEQKPMTTAAFKNDVKNN